MKTCKLCAERGKTWMGSDPRCAFLTGRFSRKNWNCATLNELRDFSYEGQELPSWIAYQYCDDMKYATIAVDDCDGLDGALALWLCWYKSRGATDNLLLLFSDAPARPPTEAETLAVIGFLKARAKQLEKANA